MCKLSIVVYKPYNSAPLSPPFRFQVNGFANIFWAYTARTKPKKKQQKRRRRRYDCIELIMPELKCTKPHNREDLAGVFLFTFTLIYTI